MLTATLPSSRFNRFLRHCSLLIIALFSTYGSVQAAEVPYLYQAEILVPDQLAKTRQLAIKKGLGTVLIRVTGDTDILNKPGVEPLTRQPDKYITQYRYRPVSAPVDEKGRASSPPPVTAARVLVVDFQQQAIENQLAKNNIAIWPASRPRILIWLTQENQGSREWVRFKTDIAAQHQLDIALRNRGLPSEVPLLDLEDESNLPLGVAGGLISDVIQSASMRYQPDAILAGRSYIDPNGEQQGNWLLIDGERHLRFYTSSPAGQNPFEPIVNQVADYFAAQYTRDATNPDQHTTGVDIRVLPLINISHYASLTHYLEGLSAVKAVYPTLISKEYTIFHINTDLNQEQFHNLIKLDKKLHPSTTGEVYKPAQPILFQWAP